MGVQVKNPPGCGAISPIEGQCIAKSWHCCGKAMGVKKGKSKFTFPLLHFSLVNIYYLQRLSNHFKQAD